MLTFLVNFWSFLIIGGLWPLQLLPKDKINFIQIWWSKGIQFFTRWVMGIKVKELGLENFPKGAVIVAVKHHSGWETTIFQGKLDWACMVLKKELGKIPAFGHYARRVDMILVDREGGATALRDMLKKARMAKQKGKQIVIFPEGTRRAVGEPTEYQTGIFGIYSFLKIPVIPVAHNAGLIWPRDGYDKTPGTITLEYLPPIEPGLGKEDFMKRLEHDIETATNKLVAEERAINDKV
jgi:1-acyl-sn-glycerol-3-phosphate acyltransferase